MQSARREGRVGKAGKAGKAGREEVGVFLRGLDDVVLISCCEEVWRAQLRFSVCHASMMEMETEVVMWTASLLRRNIFMTMGRSTVLQFRESLVRARQEKFPPFLISVFEINK